MNADKPRRRFHCAVQPPQDQLFEPGEYEWIERNAIENLKGRTATADTLAKEASTTLTVLLAGIGGSLAYAIKALEGDVTYAGVAATVACGWLVLLSALLVHFCMMVRPIPAVYSQPAGLLKRREAGASFEIWRYGELLNIEDRIQEAITRNRRVATKLNLVRTLAYLTPVVVAVFALLTHSPKSSRLVATVETSAPHALVAAVGVDSQEVGSRLPLLFFPIRTLPPPGNEDEGANHDNQHSHDQNQPE